MIDRTVSLRWGCLGFVLYLGLSAATSPAAYVTPQIGGGQVGMGSAPMKHADVMFDGASITVHVDETVETPLLRPLTPPDEFDPAQPWAVLQNKAYNFQYAWNPGGFITLPGGTGIWIERVHHDAGLECYLRPPASSLYEPVFTADGSRWQWSGAMQHNVYAVLNPAENQYSATYRVYIGDVATGDPLTAYGSAQVTWTWNATPVPEPGCAGVMGLAAAALAGRGQRRWRARDAVGA